VSEHLGGIWGVFDERNFISCSLGHYDLSRNL
jgi:hypothetical protein